MRLNFLRRDVPKDVLSGSVGVTGGNTGSTFGVFVEVCARGPVSRVVLTSALRVLALRSILGLDLRDAGNSALVLGSDDETKGDTAERPFPATIGPLRLDEELLGARKDDTSFLSA